MRLECSNLTERNTFIRNFVRTLEFCDFGEKVFREAFFSRDFDRGKWKKGSKFTESVVRPCQHHFNFPKNLNFKF